MPPVLNLCRVVVVIVVIIWNVVIVLAPEGRRRNRCIRDRGEPDGPSIQLNLGWMSLFMGDGAESNCWDRNLADGAVRG